jgi:NADPH:quinone reductase-like Zn-dependent oxidoreductase
MKAIFHETYGGPEVLRFGDLPRPEPGPGDVLVQVHAAGINGYDLMVRAGSNYRPNEAWPHIPGGDMGGVVAELGPGVERSDLQPGRRCTAWWVVPCDRCEQCMSGHFNRCALRYRYLGAHLRGCYAQYVVLPARNVVPIPDTMTFEEAAAFPNPYGTAWHMLITRARVRPGETVLVQAAGAGVSIAGIQILKLGGCRVIATAGSDEKCELARRLLGVDEAINYRQQDFQAEVMRLTGKRGVDLVLEHVGSDVFEKSIRCLTRGGRLVTCGGTAGYQVSFNVAYVFHKELTIIGSNSAVKPELDAMMPHVASGRLKPIVDRVFPLEEAAEAHRYVEARRNFGKVVLRVPQEAAAPGIA